MHLKPAAPIACVLAALVTTGTGRVHALSCAVVDVVVPIPESVHVPTNTLVWCSRDPLRPSVPITLRDSEGANVSGTQTQMSLPWYELLIYRPDAELTPNSQYIVDCPVRYEGQPSSFAFTTGPGSRATPPAVPSVATVDIAATEDGGWGPSYYANFLGASEPQTIVVVDLGGDATLNPGAPSGYVADANFHFRTSDIFVGRGPCGGNWDGANLGASTTVALGAFDMTGAFSGWSDTVTVTIPSEYDTVVDAAEVVEENSREPPDFDADGDDDMGEDDDVVAEDDADGYDIVSPNAPDGMAYASSPTGRSGCGLGTRGAYPWGTAGLLSALVWLGARRRREAL